MHAANTKISNEQKFTINERSREAASNCCNFTAKHGQETNATKETSLLEFVGLNWL